MVERLPVDLGAAQETLLIPLYGRAVETRKKHAVLRDARAVSMVEAIDYDFARFDGARSLWGTVLRTGIFDTWARAFVAEHPAATVVELGCGLNTRFDRVDNGRLHWVDVDLPDGMALRRAFFSETDRCHMFAGSVLDAGWVADVKARPGPYLIVAEAMLAYLGESEVRHALGLIAEHFPGARIAFDTAGIQMVANQDRHDSLGKVTGRMRWACDDPRELEGWVSGCVCGSPGTCPGCRRRCADGCRPGNGAYSGRCRCCHVRSPRTRSTCSTLRGEASQGRS